MEQTRTFENIIIDESKCHEDYLYTSPQKKSEKGFFNKNPGKNDDATTMLIVLSLLFFSLFSYLTLSCLKLKGGNYLKPFVYLFCL